MPARADLLLRCVRRIASQATFLVLARKAASVQPPAPGENEVRPPRKKALSDAATRGGSSPACAR